VSVVALKMIFSLVFSFLITLYLVPVCATLANKLHFIDVPDGRIKRHKQSTPYLGGVAVYCGFLCGIALTIPFENKIFLFLVGTTLLLLTGLIDDLCVLKPYQKLFGQLIASLCYLKAGLYLKEHFFYNFWNIPLSFFWIVSLINAFNFVDVMDGLATLLAIMATVGFLSIAVILGHHVAMNFIKCLFGGINRLFLV